ncbi:unnamed protein product [Echinostoma caproni]|uniref:Microtubule-associated protein Jupiter n=1 Tax=Echinostoma caproni TaxID=27848 RepID=A0A183A5G8_9TREM|nr:unnamed protein product [Echinostoma caproni]
MQYVTKLSGFQCATPSEVAGYSLTAFRAANLCKPIPKEPVTKSAEDTQIKDEVHTGVEGEDPQRFGPVAVIEHPSPARGGTGAPKSGTSGVNNSYNRDADHIERQPLAPGYRDNRL